MRDVVQASDEDAVTQVPEVIVADRQAIVCQGLGSLVARIPEVRLGAFANDKASLRKALRGAAQALVETLDMPEARIDGAMVAHGFRKGVFGRRDPGPDSPAVMRRLVAALISEGAGLLAEGHVKRPSDIDALAVHGLGYPRRQGGPCRVAQTMGLLALRNDMRTWSEDNLIWEPPEMLDEAVKLAAGFDAL